VERRGKAGLVILSRNGKLAVSKIGSINRSHIRALAAPPMPQPRHTNTTRIAELERQVLELQQQMAKGRQDLTELKGFVEDRKAIDGRVQRQLREYEREHKAMRSVADEVLGVTQSNLGQIANSLAAVQNMVVDNELPFASNLPLMAVENDIPCASNAPLMAVDKDIPSAPLMAVDKDIPSASDIPLMVVDNDIPSASDERLIQRLEGTLSACSLHTSLRKFSCSYYTLI
jgi:hypothetical protein